MSAITNGAELVKRLKDHGTGETKLAVVRKLLADTHRIENRVAHADEVLAELVKAGVGEGTLLKARTLAETGEWKGPPADLTLSIEDELLGARTPPAPAPPPVTGPSVEDVKALVSRVGFLERQHSELKAEAVAKATEASRLRAEADEHRERAERLEQELASAKRSGDHADPDHAAKRAAESVGPKPVNKDAHAEHPKPAADVGPKPVRGGDGRK
jgi:hypothetical protein